ncbi:MAG TPA: helix-turn-helix transcriptional regulator [Rhizomicrobium sp.]|jgi:AraC-like DNA-binding protein|nr:helix-turn-helix transcriptional regulator [Rhizomicrobium sp.]
MRYALRSVGLTYGDGHVLEAHSHDWGQLIFAISGTMRVAAADVLWLVPPGRALWAPPDVVHGIAMRGAVAMRTIYVPPERVSALPALCTALEVDPLLRALILHIVARGMLGEGIAADERLAGVFLDRLAAAARLVLHLPMPRERRTRLIADKLCAAPADTRSLPALARAAKLSARTVQRVFQAETGMRFVEWRQRLRLIHAITALDMGASVTAAGADAGYASSSAFIAAFRQQMGETPGQYVKTGQYAATGRL